jgi:hypothetical protein
VCCRFLAIQKSCLDKTDLYDAEVCLHVLTRAGTVETLLEYVAPSTAASQHLPLRRQFYVLRFDIIDLQCQ